MAADPNIGREIANQFRILEKIGSGGMGAVYKAEQPDMRRFVAIKVLHPRYLSRPDLVSRFRREARAMSHLTHPNTAKVFLYGQLDDGACYFAMEYLEGKNLAQTVRSEGPMDPSRAIHVMVQVCGALEEAHAKGIVHRDLKPENVFLTNLGGIPDYPKVLDFGLAKVTEREMRPGSLILTQDGMVFGTPEFMSPEQARGEKLDGRSDIYSLGVILYELVSGKLPFDAAQPMEYIRKHIKEQPIPLATRRPDRHYPDGFWEVLAKSLAKHPDERHQTANELAQALRDVIAPRSTPDGSYRPPPYQQTPYPHPSPVAMNAASPGGQYGTPQPYSQNGSGQPGGYAPQPYAPQSQYAPQAQYAPQTYGTPQPGAQPQFSQAHPAHSQGGAQPAEVPQGIAAPGSRAPWLVLGAGALLAMLGVGALILALLLR